MSVATTRLLAVSVLSAILLFDSGEAVKCYRCDDCMEPFKEAAASTCQDNFCTKLTSYSTGKRVTSRTCARAVTHEWGCIGEVKKPTGVEVCVCARDLCNGSSLPARLRILLLVSLAVSLASGALLFGR